MTQESIANGATNVAFFSRTYHEALTLTYEARDYIAMRAGHNRGADSPDCRLASSCEEMRLTSRLTQVMAWLLLQRAVHAGEVDREEALKPENRLSGEETCLGDPVIPDAPLPPKLDDLLARSRALYERVQRLDAMLDN